MPGGVWRGDPQQGLTRRLEGASLTMAERRMVSAEILTRIQPLTIVLDSPSRQYDLVGEEGEALEMVVRGAGGRDVWIFSVTVVDEHERPVTSLEVVKVRLVRPSGLSLYLENLWRFPQIG